MLPNIALTIQIHAFVISIPFVSKKSPIQPPMSEEQRPNSDTTTALTTAYVLFKSGAGQRRLKNFGRKNPMENPPKKRKKPPMATHLHVGFVKISCIAERNF